MPAYVRVWWAPEPLIAKVKAAHVKASEDVKRVAQLRCHSSHVRAEMRVLIEGNRAQVIAPGKVASFLEHGTHPHEEKPRNKQALKFKDGGFAKVVQHPGMKAEPFLRPAAALYPELYRTRAREALA